MTDQGASDLAGRLRRTLADHLIRDGCLTDPAWRTAVEAVPREVFLGLAIAGPTGHGDRWEVVRRDDVTADEWLELVYRDETWATELDEAMVEGASVVGSSPGSESVLGAEGARSVVSGGPTSSSTMPGLVVRMLELPGSPTVTRCWRSAPARATPPR